MRTLTGGNRNAPQVLGSASLKGNDSNDNAFQYTYQCLLGRFVKSSSSNIFFFFWWGETVLKIIVSFYIQSYVVIKALCFYEKKCEKDSLLELKNVYKRDSLILLLEVGCTGILLSINMKVLGRDLQLHLSPTDFRKQSCDEQKPESSCPINIHIFPSGCSRNCVK